MIIGNGLLAKALRKIDSNEIIWFASGVSDSKTSEISEFEREEKLLLKTIEENREKKIIYFSTYSLLDDSLKSFPYINHKLKMEELIKYKALNYLIVRTSNVFGKTGNAKTILNYLCNSINENISFEVWESAHRNLLDVEDLVLMLKNILSLNYTNQILYLVNPISYDMPTIVKGCESYLKKEGKKVFIKKGCNFSYPTELSETIFKKENLTTKNYLLKLLTKYY